MLRKEALRVTREALHAGLLAPERARTLVVSLARSIAGEPEPRAAAADVATAALRELSEPWAALDPLPHERLFRFLEAGPDCAAAAIEAAARHGHRNLLRDVAADRNRPPVLRRQALELLGDLASRDDIGGLVNIAATDPLLLAGRPSGACAGCTGAGTSRRATPCRRSCAWPSTTTRCPRTTSPPSCSRAGTRRSRSW
ncbi:hypothetical protein ACFQY7_04075 [Actinomadura luteofluorescens]|uniref:hypothetical protein n=1 Tax=Actinomadura luteofluorescens TaxID=46163 RepID=UPI003625D81E